MKTILNIKTEKALKVEAQKTAKELGLSLSAVVTQQLKDFVKERKVIFTDHPMPNTATRRILDMVLRDIKAKKNLSKAFSNTKEMDAYLDG